MIRQSTKKTLSQNDYNCSNYRFSLRGGKKAIRCFLPSFILMLQLVGCLHQQLCRSMRSISLIVFVSIFRITVDVYNLSLMWFTLKKPSKCKQNNERRPTTGISFIIYVSLTHHLIQFASEMKYSYRLN